MPAARRLTRLVRLARWLGPWAGEDAAPTAVAREAVRLPGPRGLRAYVYRPATPPAGSLFLVPGLHYAGPDDPRMDRFARVLAHGGLLVFAPFLPDFLDLQLRPALIDDAEQAFDALLARPDRPPGRPGALSISFGSLPLLRLAARRSHDLSGAIVFGGYAEWEAAMRFAVTGAADVPFDPLNRPVVFLNLLDLLPGAPADPAARAALAAAWRAFVERTWGRPEMKAEARYRPVAVALEADLPPAARPLFRAGCGLDPGGEALVEAAVARATDRGWLDPRPHLADIRCPVHVVHGAGDDVIPCAQAHALAAALPPAARAGTYVTGVYGHTGRALPAIPALAREARTMVAILQALIGLAEPRGEGVMMPDRTTGGGR